MNSCNKYKYSKNHFSKAKRKLKWAMYISEFKSKTCNFQHFLCRNIHVAGMVYKSLKLCSHFAGRYYSKIIMLRNDLSTQTAECSTRMKSPQVTKTRQLSSPETCNMTSTVEKTNINNVKDDQNCNWTLQEIELLLEKLYFSWFLVPFYLMKCIPKSLCSNFLSGVELLRFMLRTASEQYYPVPNNSPSLLLISFWISCRTLHTPVHSYLDPPSPLINFPDFVLQIFQRLKPVVLFPKP